MARRLITVICLAVWLTGTLSVADDWPTFRHDMARSGVTSETIEPPLAQAWVFKTLHPPVPAWGDPKPVPVEGILELRRVHFDDVFQPVAVGGSVYFGSSASNKVYCLDAASGTIRWTTITDGPVRLAPTVVDGRVYVGSDDGHAYCLNAEDGSIIWKFRGAPADRRVLGNGKMISLWPLRTGLLVDDGVVYFTAGFFPGERVYFFALNAEDGTELWRNDNTGETTQGRVSPQGYSLASQSTLFFPMGRVSPTAFDRKTGQIKYETYFGKPVGGTYALLADKHIYTGTEEMVAFDAKTRSRFAVFSGRKMVVNGDIAYLATETRLTALDRKAFPAASKKVHSLKSQQVMLGRDLSGSRRERRALERDLNKVETSLDRAEKELAKQPQSASLKTQVAQLKTDLAEKTTALDAQRKQHAPLEAEAAELADNIKKAQAAFEATRLWDTACPCHDSLILAGDVLFAGGPGQVVAVQASSGKLLWTGKVEGAVKGLAAANGRLLASTDKGLIYCFAGATKGDRSPIGIVAEPAKDNPFAGSATAAVFAKAAEQIVGSSGVKRGYCLVVGCETGELALELARRTDLMIHVVDPDARKVAAARKAIDASGLYGARICVEQWPLDAIPYSDYFANLIVSETVVLGDALPSNSAELLRMLKPCGGTILLGQPAEKSTNAKPLAAKTLQAWLDKSGLPGGRVSTEGGNWLKVVRGPLPGAGSWTHQYANAGNTTCGDDQIVKCPLGVLWFGHPGPGEMVNRHRRAASPLATNGRMFVQGENVLMAYDVYNGVQLWHRELQGAMRVDISHQTSNMTVNDDSLFVAIGKECLRFDPATGQTTATYAMPPDPKGKIAKWGYIACLGDTLYGTRSTAANATDCLFALDIATGKIRWVYEGKYVPHSSISIGDGRVFLVDSKISPEQRERVIERRRREIAKLPEIQRTIAQRALETADVRMAVALDARTGRQQWQVPLDVTYCGGTGGYHNRVSTIYNKGAVVVFGVYMDGHYWKQFFAGEFASRTATVLSADDGKLLWSHPVGHRVRPLVIGNTLHAEPWAFDLHTGEQRKRINPITGLEDNWQYARPGHHCGIPAASEKCLFFRSACLGYYDLVNDSGTMHFSAQRPGCWINFIPADGLLLFPEASVGCMCAFPNMCTVVFKPTEQNKAWSMYSTPGPTTPVKRLAINLGAPGDRKDAAGGLWLGYPRPYSGRLVLGLKLGASFYPGGRFTRSDSTYTNIAQTDDPWLFTSAANRLRKCEIPLLEENDGTALYRVRLGFVDTENRKPGQRVFDIKLQGKLVEENFDIVEAAGGPNRVVFKEFDGVEVTDKLAVELIAKVAKPEENQYPVLQTVEVNRQRMLTLGCSTPDFLTSSMEPKQSGEIQLVNLRDTPFEGTLQCIAPDGFKLSATQTPIKLPAGQRMTVPIELVVGDKTPAANYTLAVKLLRADGSVELERSSPIEHLGSRGRLVLPAVEDVYVNHGYPAKNHGSAAVMLVDGGHQAVGDVSHNLGYLKFRLEVPGKPVSVRLRLYNAGNPSGNSGRVCLVTEPWSEMEINYKNRPKPGKELAQIGSVAENQVVDLPLKLDLTGRKELSLIIDPTSCDGVDYLTREGGHAAELIIEYEPSK